MQQVWLVNLETMPYADALELQRAIVAARKRGALRDALLLLEHPPVLTLGRNAKDEHILASRDALRETGVEVFRVERGGDVTYHGPGQLVGYPILNLKNFRQDVGWYVRALEETLMRALADFGIASRRVDKLVGVWVAQDSAEAKVAQIGARIEEWVTYHGFALNVAPNLAHFELIVPCGITDKAVTTMTRLLHRPVAMRAVRERIAARFAEVFEVELVEQSYADLRVQLEK